MENAITEKSYVSIGLLSMVFAGLLTAVWYTSSLAKQTEINTADIQQQSQRISDLPSRTEFNDLKKGIEDIQKDIKQILQAKILK